MRWFKHLTRAHLDEQVAALIHEDGLEAYGFYWILLEVIAESMDSTGKCELTHTLPQWSHLCYSHHHRVGKYLGKLKVMGLVTVKNEGSKITVSCPNLLKYRDEYAKKSRHATDTVRSKRQSIDTDTDTDTDIKNHLSENSDVGPSLQPKKREPSQEEKLAAQYAPAIHARHIARKCTQKAVREKLVAILRRVNKAKQLELVETIDRNHQANCASEDWTKDGGQFCPGLEKWLNAKQERYLIDLPPGRASPTEQVWSDLPRFKGFEKPIE